MSDFSKIIIPLFILVIIGYGLKKKINIYDSFLEGAKEGMNLTFGIFPTIIAMIFAINLFLDSNILLIIVNPFINILNSFNIPFEALPMALLRPISGSATLTIMNDVLVKYGADSFAGNLVSIMQGCTDTTLYVLALYFSSVKIYKTRYALKVGLFADFIGIIFAIILTNVFF